jgi:two-component system, NarL family, sensor histidine kinase DevS
VIRFAVREIRAEQLVEANLSVGSEASLGDVLHSTVEVAATLVGGGYAALEILDDRSYLERPITTGIDQEARARIGELPSDHGVPIA